MENLQFKTNIKCGGCIEKVKPALDQVVGAGNWKVDITSPEKTLTLSTKIEAAKVKMAVQKAGFTAEQL
jgi:copper chaperone